MGLHNWLVQKAMKREAERIAKSVAEAYPVLKVQNPDRSETDILTKLISDDLSGMSENLRTHIRNCCVSVEGVCYMIAMDIGALKGFMAFRCLQFTKYMDTELYARGFRPQTRETKKAVLKELKLLVDGWEQWCQ